MGAGNKGQKNELQHDFINSAARLTERDKAIPSAPLEKVRRIRKRFEKTFANSFMRQLAALFSDCTSSTASMYVNASTEGLVDFSR